MKRIGIFILFIMLISNISINVYAKKGDEIKAYKKFLNKEKVKYCLGEKFEDDISGFYVGYNFLDIDGDGIKELLIFEENNLCQSKTKIYKYKNKKVNKISVYLGTDYIEKEIYNKKYEDIEYFIKDIKHKKNDYFYGFPLYRIKGKKDIIFYGYDLDDNLKYYIYYKYKDGKFYQTEKSLFNDNDRKIKYSDVIYSYLYKKYNLKGKLLNLENSITMHLISVEKDKKTGNIKILNAG